MIFETFSKRQKKLAEQGKNDVYVYDNIPQSFRNQVIHIWNSAIGQHNQEAWSFIHNQMCREIGLLTLGWSQSPYENTLDYFLKTEDDHVLDLIELSFKVVDQVIRGYNYYKRLENYISQDPDNAIEELNHRFKEHNLGYEFVGGELTRIDSQHIHEQVVKPAIKLLAEEDFSGALNEFTTAHRLYRTGDYKQAIVEALKSFESTMKAICKRKHWNYNETDPASKLINILFENEFIPAYMQSHFTALRACLESGLPTLRNKTSGHGQGEEVVAIPEHYAEYAINLAATNIVFLVRTYKNK